MMHALVEAYLETESETGDPIIGYDAHGNPKTAEEMKVDLKTRLESAKKGNYVSLDQLKNRLEKWLKGTKP